MGGYDRQHAHHTPLGRIHGSLATQPCHAPTAWNVNEISCTYLDPLPQNLAQKGTKSVPKIDLYYPVLHSIAQYLMDPIAVSTATLAFAALISDVAAVGRTFVEVPQILSNLQRDLKAKVTVISHIASLLVDYRPSDKFRTVHINIVRELNNCIDNLRPLVMKLLHDLCDLAETPVTTRLGWKRRFRGLRNLPSFEQRENEIRRQMESFDQLKNNLSM